MNQDEELALHTWILTGNAVSEILRGLPATQVALRDNIAALQSRLENVPAERILDRIANLPAHDRDLLIAICDKCVDILGSECGTRLGLSHEEAQTVLTHIRAI
jgi:hypothetical protein